MFLARLSWILVALLPSMVRGESFPDDSNIVQSECPHQPYKVHIFSRHPLVIYIENFVSAEEALQLTTTAEPTYQPSKVYIVDNVTGEVSEGLDDGHRSSYTTGLWDGGEGSLTRCIKKRAASFQGLPLGHLEALQVVRYELNGYFNEHLDWFSHAENCTGNDCEPMGDRLSTFFVYLEADCTGGETSFPKLSLPEDMDQEWCEFVECGEGRTGVKWKPKAGNAIFWENLDKDGKGLTDMLHAGMPVTSGSKIGLNIWTRERDHNGWAPPKAEEKEEVEGSGEPQTTAFTNHHAEL